MEDNRREQILNLIEKEFIGPDPVDFDGLLQDNGEEIIVSDPPTTRYIAGILFPENTNEGTELTESVSNQENINADDKKELEENEVGFSKLDIEAEGGEELINRSNAFKQSALSLTVAIKSDDDIQLQVKAGKYRRSKGTGKETIVFKREQIVWDGPGNIKSKFSKCSINDTDLNVYSFERKRDNGYSIYTFSLANSKKIKGNCKDEDCYFQVKLIINSKLGFHYLPDYLKINKDEDYESNALLYRTIKNYAIGHGCAADWKEEGGIVHRIETAIFPSYEIKPIVPTEIKGVNLSMLKMSKRDEFEDTLNQLSLMCNEYDKWIGNLEKHIKDIDKRLKSTAEKHILNCKNCSERMKRGVELLSKNNNVKAAFLLMNEAMMLQQLHYNLPLQKWSLDEKRNLVLRNGIKHLPVLEDEKTWYEKEKRIYGKWRPFQIAFILINLSSLEDEMSDDRKIVDLIWFPTGGGKTEAYLGLSAYTIFLRRIRNKNDNGTSILMRYTLRLLTAQQFERASSLICACEILRRKNKNLLGENEINIGLWVGSETTPNTRSDAVKRFDELKTGTSNSNPFILLKCPWCGAQMGLVADDKIRLLPGYKKNKLEHGKKTFLFRCENSKNKCDFSDQNGLPLYVIDEDIYEKTPTLIVGTVDKFARLPFRPESRGIFGFNQNGTKISSPDLIIQDELHLISGPLGSMVGFYETMINKLCFKKTEKGIVYPKIIASTATISRAKDQCHALYGCERNEVFQFPPSGLDAKDSFFAKEDKEKNGRIYVGVLANGSPSDATTSIRLFASLLYAAKAISVKNEGMRDPYWTNVAYYNSIRELGQAKTWIKADIEHHLDVMYKRRHDDEKLGYEKYKKYRRYIYREEELTSRIFGSDLTKSLSRLNIPYSFIDNSEGKTERPIDICLATNMISVGLDIQRLGLMTVVGQPKTTSEYIQATSRVGRDASNAPGMVFVLYRPGKPRDKSYYEHFRTYHSKLYSNVEPTSVTPFSVQVVERALHAVIIGIMRLINDEKYNSGEPKILESNAEEIKKFILNRVNIVDKDELEMIDRHIADVFAKWKDWKPTKWNYGINYGDATPLFYEAGKIPNASWGGRGFKTPTSMRNVDASCKVEQLKNKED